MSLSGVKGNSAQRQAKRQIIGLVGIRVQISGMTPVQVTDFRGKALSGVTLEAENPTSGTPYTTTTDGGGNARMQLDSNTALKATKDRVVTTVAHNGAATEIIEVDAFSIDL